MRDEPYPTEQIHDPQFEQLIGHLCLEPAMYTGLPSYDSVCAYISGFNAARNGGPLMGFHQWLVVRANGGENLHWSALVRQILSLDESEAALPGEEQSIRALGRHFTDFFEYRRANGLTKVFHDHAKWLLRRKWYTGPLRRIS